MIKKGLYKHYKGGYYHVLEVAKHSETEQELVVYRALYGEFGLWARPLYMFEETVLVEGAEQLRFQRLVTQTSFVDVLRLDLESKDKSKTGEILERLEQQAKNLAGFVELRVSTVSDSKPILNVLLFRISDDDDASDGDYKSINSENLQCLHGLSFSHERIDLS